MASAAPSRPQPKPNMKSGVQPIWRTSDVVDHTAGTRTLPSPRMTLSNMLPRKVMAAPPKRTRAKSVALACTAPLAPIRWNSGAAHTCRASPKPRPITTLSTSACPASAAASFRRPAPSARALAPRTAGPGRPRQAGGAPGATGPTATAGPAGWKEADFCGRALGELRGAGGGWGPGGGGGFVGGGGLAPVSQTVNAEPSKG